MSLLDMLDRASKNDSNNARDASVASKTELHTDINGSFAANLNRLNLSEDADTESVDVRWYDESNANITREIAGFPAGMIVTAYFDQDGWWPCIVIPQWFYRWFNHNRMPQGDDDYLGAFSPDSAVYVLALGKLSVFMISDTTQVLPGLRHVHSGGVMNYRNAVTQARAYIQANPIRPNSNHIGQYVVYQSGAPSSREWCTVQQITPNYIVLDSNGSVLNVPREEWHLLRWVGPPPTTQHDGVWNDHWDVIYAAAAARVAHEQRKREREESSAAAAAAGGYQRTTRSSRASAKAEQRSLDRARAMGDLRLARQGRATRDEYRGSLIEREQELELARQKSVETFTREQNRLAEETKAIQEAIRRSYEDEEKARAAYNARNNGAGSSRDPM